MESHVTNLESELRRLSARLEALERSVSLVKEQQYWRSWVAGHLVITAVLLVAMAVGFGWI
jgi:hypothetical protein